MNEVILIGNLVADVELKINDKGTVIVAATVAINRGVDANGKEREADFIRFYAFNQTAENIAKYCHKGSKVCVKGRIVNRSWEKEDGSKAYQTTVYANRVIFLDSKKNNGIPLPDVEPTKTVQTIQEEEKDPFKDFGEEIAIADDDLPF